MFFNPLLEGELYPWIVVPIVMATSFFFALYTVRKKKWKKKDELEKDELEKECEGDKDGTNKT